MRDDGVDELVFFLLLLDWLFNLLLHNIGKVFIFFGFEDTLGQAVELRIGKVFSNTLEVHNGKPHFAFVLANACATAYDLLELTHALDGLVEDDELARFDIHACGEELGGSDNGGIVFVRLDEAIKLLLALFIVAGDAHDIAHVLASSLTRGIDQGATPALGVFGGAAKDDGLSKWITKDIEIFDNLLGHYLVALGENDSLIDILELIDTVGHGVAVVIECAGHGAPTGGIVVEDNADNFVRSEEAIINPLRERVGVDRVLEEMRRTSVFGFLRRG